MTTNVPEPEADVCQLPLWPQDRIAAVDIGSNSVRLVVAQVEASGGYRVLDEERENTRLAAAIDATGRLDDDAIEQSLVVLRHYQKIVEGYRVSHVRAIATAAVRDAANGAEFVDRVRHQVGIEIEIIPPEEEGRLAYLSVAKAFDVADRRVAVADIGGGSTEIVLASCGLIDNVYATQLGAVRIAERCELYDAVDGENSTAPPTTSTSSSRSTSAKPRSCPRRCSAREARSRRWRRCSTLVRGKRTSARSAATWSTGPKSAT